MHRQALFIAFLTISVGVRSGRAQAPGTSPPSSSCTPCNCPKLDIMGRTVAAACAAPAVAALPQMAAACALAATLGLGEQGVMPPEGGVTLPIASTAGWHTNTDEKSRVITSGGLDLPPPADPGSQQDAPALVTIANQIDIPARAKRYNMWHKDRSERRTRTNGKGVRHRRAASASFCSPSILASLRVQCAVSGCFYDFDHDASYIDVLITCHDATVISFTQDNRTACSSLVQVCEMEIDLYLPPQPKHPGSFENAALLIDTWQNDVFVHLHGQWSEEELSAVLQHGHSVTNLDASKTGITFLSSTTFAKLTSLRSLYLDANNIRSIVTGAFFALKKLERLDLSDNALTVLPPDLLQKCSQLSVVNLDWNKLIQLESSLFHHSPRLNQLSLRGNKLTKLNTDQFQGMSALSYLDVGENQLSSLPGDIFQGLSNLTKLNLYENRLASIDSIVFRGLSRLHYLQLGLNQLTCLPDGIFHGLSALYLLDLEGNQLTHLSDAIFEDLSKLITLYLSDNNLAHVDATALNGLFALRVLELENNPLNRLQKGLFVVPAKLTSLSELWLESTGISKLHLLQPNTTLKYLTVKHNYRLTDIVLASGTRVDQADVTGTALRIADLPCEALGYQGLVARKMQQMTVLDLLTNCVLGDKRLFLDVSENGERRVGVVRDKLSSVAASFLKGNQSWHLNGQDVREQPISLILVASPVQCSIGMVQRRVLFYSNHYKREPLQMFSCECIPGYYEQGGVCYEKTPFVATAGGIVTVVLTTLLGAGLLVLVALCQKRFKKRLRHAHHDLEMQRSLLDYAESEVVALKRVWEIEADEVTLIKRIDGDSEGAFGAVWRGDWDGMMVAVKVLRAGLLELDSSFADEFDREADFLMRARYANVVRFFGAGRMPGGEPFVVLELVSRGSLRGLLRGDQGSQLDDALKQRLALDVARGMAYIHSLGALHRDLKSGNVLVTENWRGKVADFGSMRTLLASAATGSGSGTAGDASSSVSGAVPSAVSSARELTLTAGVGTPLYMSLEVLRGDDYGEAADVWAFGVLVWELVEQRSPDLLLETGDQGGGPLLGRLLKLLEAGKRLQLGDEAPAWTQSVVTECMLAEAGRRPSFAVLKNRLTDRATSK